MGLDILQGRPNIEDAPSGLRKITRVWKLEGSAVTADNLSDYLIPYGTADEEHDDAFLIDQRIERRTEQGNFVSLIRVYQQLADTLTATTEVTETTLFDGRRITRTTYLCKADQAATLRPAISGGVFQVDIEKLGPVARVVKSEITLTSLGFVYSDSTDTRNNGKLIVRTIRTLGQIAATPAGYTIVTNGTTVQDGYTIYNAVFAKGEGRISTDVDTRLGGKLVVTTIRFLETDDTATPDGVLIKDDDSEQDGYTLTTRVYADGEGRISSDVAYRQNGKLKITTIRYLETDDAATPAGELVNDDSREEDGYTVFTKGYAEIVGDGVVVNETETREGGKLVLYHSVRLGTVPDTPAATISGTVALIQANSRQEDGFTLYDYRWAEGNGEISRDIDYLQSDDLGTTGITRTTITHLTALSVGADPTTLVGSVKVSERKVDRDGHRIWTIVYSKGTGLVIDETDVRIVGRLLFYRRVALGAAPSTPTATISGTVTLASSSVRKEAGFDVYDYRWVEGAGQSTIETVGQPDGAIDYIVTTISAAAETPSYPGAGTAYLIRLEQTREDAFFRNRAVYRKPPATITFKKQVAYTMPGLASFTGTDLTLSPPTTRFLLADVEVSYDETQLTDEPFTVEAYASFQETYTPTASGLPVSSQRGLGGYLSGATSVSGTNDVYNGVECDAFEAVLVSSIPSARPTGATILNVDNDDYLVSTEGTKVFRRTKITYSF